MNPLDRNSALILLTSISYYLQRWFQFFSNIWLFSISFDLQQMILSPFTKKIDIIRCFQCQTYKLWFTVFFVQFSSVQSLSRVRLFETPWIAARQASLSITNSRSSLRLTSIKSLMPSSHHLLSSPSPPAPNPSQHQSLFQWVNSSHEVAKVLEFRL